MVTYIICGEAGSTTPDVIHTINQSNMNDVDVIDMRDYSAVEGMRNLQIELAKLERMTEKLSHSLKSLMFFRKYPTEYTPNRQAITRQEYDRLYLGNFVPERRMSSRSGYKCRTIKKREGRLFR